MNHPVTVEQHRKVYHLMKRSAAKVDQEKAGRELMEAMAVHGDTPETILDAVRDDDGNTKSALAKACAEDEARKLAEVFAKQNSRFGNQISIWWAPLALNLAPAIHQPIQEMTLPESFVVHPPSPDIPWTTPNYVAFAPLRGDDNRFCGGIVAEWFMTPKGGHIERPEWATLSDVTAKDVYWLLARAFRNMSTLSAARQRPEGIGG